jgi:hypothetical protein
MIAPKMIETPNKENSALGKTEPVAMPIIDKLIGKCKADRRAIERLDEDQQEYLRRNAKQFLAARMKKSKKRRK